MELLEKIEKYLKRKLLFHAFKMIREDYFYNSDCKPPYSQYLCFFIDEFYAGFAKSIIGVFLIKEIQKDLGDNGVLEITRNWEKIKGFTPISTTKKGLRLEYLDFKIQQYGNKTKNK